ncbi:MAG: R3H domain-containing nucleic acid-binding protein [Candidatus Paceibacterota bacterium]|jgi:spoIIIJ-associated protein
MDKKELLKKIQKQSDIFFEKTGFPGETKAEFDDDQETILLSIKLEDPQVLIGKKGETLGMLQHILTKIVKKIAGEEIKLSLDINEYKKRKTVFLKELAQITADEVSLNKKDKELEPMPSYERRIIHMLLKERKDVVTESVGEGEDRRIVIRPSK